MLRTVLTLSLFAAIVDPVQGQDLVIQRWLLNGPIASDTGSTRIVADYIGGEAELLPTVGDEGWVEVEADAFGRLDLNAVYEGMSTAWSAAYAHTYVFAPEDRTVLLVADSDDDLVVRINGQRVWVNEVARGLGRGNDTLTVKLSEGWNSVLLKPLNRSGGFGLLGRLSPGDGLLLSTARPPGMVAHNHPEPSVTVGPLYLDSLVWEADGLFLAARAPLAAWGPDPFIDVGFRLTDSGGDAVSQQIPRVEPGEPVNLPLRLPFDLLRDAAVGDVSVTAAVNWNGGSGATDVHVDPARLLRLAGGRIVVGAWVIEGAEDRPGRLTATVVVPSLFDGFTFDLLTLGLGPSTSYRVNGVAVRWEQGHIELCGPCTAGDSLNVEIIPRVGQPLWMIPRVRVREIGYPEYADGYRYAEVLTGRAPQIEPPDPVVWLRAMSTPAYPQLLARYEEAYAPLAAEIRADTLHLVGNSHIDAAWLWPWSETREVIRDTWRTSLKLAEIFPGYIFTGSSAAFYDMLDRLEPQLADSLVAAVEAGQWVPVGGWWVESDLNVPSGESLVRQGLYGQRYFERRFGFRSRVAWTPDCFGYPWTIPQILKGSGLDYFVTQKIRWNDSTEFPYNAFHWQGLDGSRVLTYNPYGYTHNLAASSLAPQRVEDRERTNLNHQIVLYGVGDHGGGPTIAMLQRAEDLRRVPTFPAMVFADPLNALEAVEAAGRDAGLPVWDDELYLEYHRGTYTSQANTKRRNRRSEEMLLTAEALATVGASPYPRERLEAAWRLVLFNQFHDILPGSSIPEVYDDAEAFYDSAWAVIDSLSSAAFAELRARMDTRNGRSLVVYNPLGWSRTGSITVARGDGSLVRIAATDVPAFGAKAIRVPNDTMPREVRRLRKPEAGQTWIENAFLRVEVDTTTGDIVRLYDKENEREALAAGERGNVLQVFDDRPDQWDAWNIVITGDMWEIDDVASIAPRVDPWKAELEIVRRWGNSTFRQTLVLARDSRYLDIQNEVDWHEHRKALKVAFALGIVSDSATYEIPYGTVGRTGRPRTQAERAKFEVAGQRWADVSQAEYGVSVLNDSKYGWDYRGNVLRLTLLKSAIWPDSLADRGVHRFRYAVYPHTGDWRTAETVRRAAEYNTPLLAAFEPEHEGTLGRDVSFASAYPGNVEITSLKRAEDSDAWVLRLVEWHGVPTDVEVRVGCRVAGARRANLLEDPVEPVAVDGEGLHVSVRPYEIATLMVECE